ncbi:MAG: DUF504 domain-containing protein [Candidatus Woesearchaeota archaeon]
MKHIKDVLNKIIWDAREHPEEYSIGYYDRVQDQIIEIPFKEISRIEEGFLIIGYAGKETMVPLHRIRVVRKKDEVIWQRLTTNN